MAWARKRRSPAPMSTPSSTKTTPFTGWSRATHHRRKPASATTSGSSLNSSREPRPEADHDEAAEPRPAHEAPLQHPATSPARGRRRRRRRASRPVMAWPAMARRRGQGEEAPDLEGDLVGGRSAVPMRVGHGGGDQQRGPQRGGTDEAGRGRPRGSRRIDARRGRAPRRGERADGSPGAGRPRRRASGPAPSPGRRADAQVEPEDEDELEHEVSERGTDGDDQRRAGVLEAPQVAGAGQGTSRAGKPSRLIRR